MNLEAVVHRIGGADKEGPRQYGPWMRPVGLEAWDRERFELPARDASRWWLTLWLTKFTPVEDGWASGELIVEGMDGQLFGRRPAMLYTEPYDVPTYCSVKTPYSDLGLFSVGLRVASRD